MLTIIIPAAGLGSRFTQAGYAVPKPLVPVMGKPMLTRVIENLTPSGEHEFILISQLPFEQTDPLLRPVDMNIQLTSPTDGAVATLVAARDFMTAEPLLIANTDQLVAFSVDEFMLSASGLDGALVTFKSDKPHHSYVETQDGVITRIVEKEVISNQAVTGVYFFQHGNDFLKHADEVLDVDDRCCGEYYVSSAIARMIASGYRLGVYEAPSVMLGTPSELQLFEVAVQIGRTL